MLESPAPASKIASLKPPQSARLQVSGGRGKGGGKGKLPRKGKDWKGQGYKTPYWSPVQTWKQNQDQKQWTGQQQGSGLQPGNGKGKKKKGTKGGGKAPKDWPKAGLRRTTGGSSSAVISTSARMAKGTVAVPTTAL